MSNDNGFPTHLKNRRPNAQHQQIREEKAEEEDIKFNAPLKEAVPTLQVIGGLVVSEELTQPVQCDLPQYSDRTVYMRTNNPAVHQLSEPKYAPSNDWYALRDRCAALLDEAKEAGLKEPSEEYARLKAELDTLSEQEYTDFRNKRAKWLSTFVRRIEPWNYGRIVGYDEFDNPVVEPIPAPNPAKPETYLVLLDDHQLLGDWCSGVGYTKAVIAASLPFSRASENRSAKNG